jgi:hypothetical protein
MSDGYEADVSDIQADAKIWKQAATDIDAPKTTAQSLTLTPYDYSFAGELIGLGDLYDQILQRVDTLLDGAKKSYTNIGTTLDNVATAYENQESDGSSNMADAAEGMEGS